MIRNLFILLGAGLSCGFAIAILWAMYGTYGLVISIVLSVIALIGLIEDLLGISKFNKTCQYQIEESKKFLTEIDLDDELASSYILDRIEYLKKMKK